VPGTVAVSPSGAATPDGDWTLVSADDDISGAGDSVVYRRIYTASPGTSIAHVTFSANATGAGGVTFASATSGSVIASPPLTFKVTVNAGAPAVIYNTGVMAETGGSFTGIKSNTTETTTSGSIGDRVWFDADGDGVQDSGEVGLSGVQVCVYQSDGITLVGCGTTDLDGLYRVAGLAAGNYVVKANPATFPAGFYPTTPVSLNVTLSNGQQYNDADYGLRPLAGNGSLGDYVWRDANNDGVQDAGEPGIPGVTVRLEIFAGGVWFPVTTKVTDANGYYLFDGLHAGQYRVTVDTDSNVSSPYAVNPPNPFKLGDVMAPTWDRDGHVATPHVAVVTLATDSTVVTDADFGYNWSGSIGDYVWWDDNLNGLQDEAPDRGIPSARVDLYFDHDGDGVLDVLAGDYQIGGGFTNASGYYLLQHLPPGNYIVKVYEDSLINDGIRDVVQTTAVYVPVTLGAGAMTNLTADFGFFIGARAEGLVWWDANHDGIRDPGEPLLANITVTLTGTDINGNSVSRTGVTDGSGYVVFIVPEGDYTITYNAAEVPASEPQLTHHVPTTATSFSFHAYPGEDGVRKFDFGVDNAGRIGDTIFADLDSSGGQDVGEPGLPGVTVRLYLDPDGAGPLPPVLQQVTATNSSGFYEFVGLPDTAGAERYVVEVLTSTLPSGYQTTPTAYPPGADVVNSRYSTALANGETIDIVDFGYPPTVTLYKVSGTVYDDNGAGGGTAGNGVQDGTEPGISNVKVTVSVDDDGAGPNPPFAYVIYTDANGYYEFGAVPAGATVIITVDPATLPSTAYVQTGDPDGTLDHTTTFTMPAADVTDQDFGYRAQYGSIGDRVWLDENWNGLQDAGEAGIANVAVRLYDAFTDTLLKTTVTDSEGNYLFSDLPPGAYRVQVDSTTLGAGLAANPTYDLDGVGSPHAASLVLARGEIRLDVDFGYNWAPSTGNLGAIGDRVWIDADGDGVQDPGEPGLGGVPVAIYYDPDGNGIYDTLFTSAVDQNGNTGTGTTVARPDGSYAFHNLAPGAYVIVVNGGVTPTGYTPTGDPDDFGQVATNPDNRTTLPIILSPGDVFVNADFGYQPDSGTAGQIGDRVWLDADGDGAQGAGEPGIPNVTVALIRDSNGNGIWDAGEPIIATTVTDANGNYLFTGLPAADGAGTDDYLVWINDTAGILDTLQPTFDFDAASPASGVVSGYGISAATDLTPAGTLAHDFGYKPFGHDGSRGLIGDRIWLDRDGDGVQDADEAGLVGVTVRLYDETGTTLLATVVTDANGNYWFGGLAAGTYVVVVETNTLPNGGVGLTNTHDPDDVNAPPHVGNNQSTVTIGGSEPLINLDQDFGYRAAEPNTIGGTIWEDRNADGTRTDGTGGTADETGNGMAGITVVLRDANGNVVGVTTTDANGDYSFTGLPDGTYAVDVTDNANRLNGYWHSLGPNPGQDNNSQSDPYTVTVSGGQTNTTADFGYYVEGAALGNRVWYDVNANGRQDSGEPGIAGVRVVLTIQYADAVVSVITTLTDANGHYSFGNLLLDERVNGVNEGSPSFLLSVINPVHIQHPYHTVHNAPGVPAALNSDFPFGVLAVAVQGISRIAANDANPALEIPQGWYDFGFTQQPTLAVISGVRSRVDAGLVTIEWDVELEADTQGYYLERWTGSGWTRVNASLLPVIPILPLPKTYAQVDPGAPLSGVVRYRILELDGGGRLLEYGPYDLEIGGSGWTYEAWAAGIAWNGADSAHDADPDGDGATNFQEWLAGTDPLSANSVLAITAIEPLADGVRLRWSSVAGRIYAIEMTTDLRHPFVAVATGIAATPPENAHVLPVNYEAIKNAFFRVRVGTP